MMRGRICASPPLISIDSIFHTLKISSTDMVFRKRHYPAVVNCSFLFLSHRWRPGHDRLPPVSHRSASLCVRWCLCRFCCSTCTPFVKWFFVSVAWRRTEQRHIDGRWPKYFLSNTRAHTQSASENMFVISCRMPNYIYIYYIWIILILHYINTWNVFTLVWRYILCGDSLIVWELDEFSGRLKLWSKRWLLRVYTI